MINWYIWIKGLFFIASMASIPSVLIRHRGRPKSALLWIGLMFFVPIAGFLFWWLFGYHYLNRKKRKKQHTDSIIAGRLKNMYSEQSKLPEESQFLIPLRNIPESPNNSVFPPTINNFVNVLIDGTNAFQTIEKAILGARNHIHLLTYIWQDDDTGRYLRDLLVRKVKEGVQVRVIYDPVGSLSLSRNHIHSIRKAGINIIEFIRPKIFKRRPNLNFRNHRKLLVVDGTWGIIGGFNIGNQYRFEWHDIGIGIVGPAVLQLQEIFAEDWFFASGEDLSEKRYFPDTHQPVKGQKVLGHQASCAVIASGPNMSHNIMHDALFTAITETRKRLYITTPYFIPTSPIMASLRSAVYRGVDVRIMIPSQSDVTLAKMASRSFYPELLISGIRVFEYQPSMLHAKSIVFDDWMSLAGSANMDNRSFRLNFEACCYIGSRGVNELFAKQFLSDQTQSKEINFDEVEGRPIYWRVADAAAHLLSPLL